MKHSISLWVKANCAALLTAPTMLAVDTPGREGAKQPIQTFTPPEVDNTRPPNFPRSSQIKGHESWVTLSMMIDTDGKPYDVTVIASSGEPEFEKSAVKAANK